MIFLIVLSWVKVQNSYQHTLPGSFQLEYDFQEHRNHSGALCSQCRSRLRKLPPLCYQLCCQLVYVPRPHFPPWSGRRKNFGTGSCCLMSVRQVGKGDLGGWCLKRRIYKVLCNYHVQQLTMEFLMKWLMQSQGTSLGLATHVLVQSCLMWMPISSV